MSLGLLGNKNFHTISNEEVTRYEFEIYVESGAKMSELEQGVRTIFSALSVPNSLKSPNKFALKTGIK